MKPFAQTQTETQGKVRLERMWMKQNGKLVSIFVKAPDNRR
jgi:hypothetical protein